MRSQSAKTVAVTPVNKGNSVVSALLNVGERAGHVTPVAMQPAQEAVAPTMRAWGLVHASVLFQGAAVGLGRSQHQYREHRNPPSAPVGAIVEAVTVAMVENAGLTLLGHVSGIPAVAALAGVEATVEVADPYAE